jgi:GNAT superfamily N-acetyltransferase
MMPESESFGPIINPVREEDIPTLLSLIRELARYESLEDEVTADEEILKSTLTGPHPAAQALLIRLSGKPVGYCIFFTTFSSFKGRPGLWIEDLFILPQARRQGIGRAVFAHLGRLARDKGCSRIEFAVLDWNQPAIDFYRDLGARLMAGWDIYRLDGPGFSRLTGPD